MISFQILIADSIPNIFSYILDTQHLTVPTEPAEVHTPDNNISIDGHMQNNIQELLPHFPILCRVGWGGAGWGEEMLMLEIIFPCRDTLVFTVECFIQKQLNFTD